MSIFGESSDDYIDDANQSIQTGYNNAANYEQPYTQYGGNDFDSARNYLIKSLSGRQNYNQDFLKYLKMSPDELLDEALSGYTESNFAKEKMAVGEDAANNAMTAEGEGGSGNNYLLDSEVGNTIMNQDENQYLSDLMKSLGVQSQILGGYDKQTKTLGKAFQDMLKTEEGASKTMADNSMREGQQEAMSDERGAMDARNRSPIKEAVSLGSALAGIFYNPTKNVKVIS